MDEENVVTGEVLIRKNANYVIELAEYGVMRNSGSLLGSGIAAGMRMIGMAGKEALGGKLFVTTHGFGFAAHALNPVRGNVFVPIHHVATIRDVSKGLSRQLEIVLTNGYTMLFIVWGVPKVIAALERARAGTR
jgi:hypothetical protein